MKFLLFGLAILFFVLGTILGVDIAYNYEVKYKQFLKLADDASTAKDKLMYFKEYREKVSNISEEHANYIFKTERMTKSTQLKILDTLISRLETTSRMKEKSLEYQQAMYQISGQEMDHTLGDIDSVFRGCYGIERREIVILCWLFLGFVFFVGGLLTMESYF